MFFCMGHIVNFLHCKMLCMTILCIISSENEIVSTFDEIISHLKS